jgi:hypothetical protein
MMTSATDAELIEERIEARGSARVGLMDKYEHIDDRRAGREIEGVKGLFADI